MSERRKLPGFETKTNKRKKCHRGQVARVSALVG